MKVHRLPVDKPCLGLVVLLFALPIVLLVLLGGSPILTILSITPEQQKAFSQGLGFLEQQGQQRLGNDVSGGQIGSPAPTFEDSRRQKSTATRDDECNYAKGKWIADKKRPLYSGYECKQWLPKKYNCGGMGRTDLSFESYRWQPLGCEMPEVSGPNFLNRNRGPRIAPLLGDTGGDTTHEQTPLPLCPLLPCRRRWSPLGKARAERRRQDLFSLRNPSKEIFSELDETFARGPIFARSFQKTEDPKWGHEEAGRVAGGKPWPPDLPPGPLVWPPR
ncbi:hypothetical protein QYE76_023338 [Lolium multiflorum]|uniref:Trichome birefringence-like N-terminal domain-containing protein n=1 Tax=Lolium multiflorum TaxID=4521 RepID=A0AAD8RBI3_LOLMU|nr:hypothetical protein QYE76_023338 [Lolium multiflorum]